MADYEALIDEETWAFIRLTESYYPPETATYPVSRQREIYDRLCRAFHRGYPPGLRVEDQAFAGVPCRVYGEGPATVVYLHGGGFVVGGLESHDDVCADIADRTGYRVVSVDYRLAPEHRHPAAFDDALAATRSVAAEFGGPVVLAGDSAGGTLAATVSHAARSEDLGIAGQVLIYPALGGDMDKGSYLTHADAPLLTRDDMLYYMAIRHEDGKAPRSDPTAAPLSDTDFSALPPTFIVTAECDPLCDDGRDYRDRIVAEGGRAHCVDERGLVHGYLRARRTVGRARESFGRICDAIAALGRGEWPY
ncbi:alpha/beta hydrolase [Ostreiculturibacter nitratireducens]|uniref:alpha/beta hydrolase n=1 Tax=Ostreiculturibacter nitratireducens TaxID=3075226 RepID=UPI0031B57F52